MKMIRIVRGLKPFVSSPLPVATLIVMAALFLTGCGTPSDPAATPAKSETAQAATPAAPEPTPTPTGAPAVAPAPAIPTAATPATEPNQVIEAGADFIVSGDFNGDGKTDLALVDRATGRVRFGYRVSAEFFNWVDWRAGGVKNVTGVTVGRLVDAQRDSLALTSAAAGAIAVLHAPSPNVATEPVAVFSEVLGPNQIVGIDIGGEGNTPLLDLYLTSIYNTDPENRVTLLRGDGSEFTQIADAPAQAMASRARRVTLQTGGPELVATMQKNDSGTSWIVETLASGKAEEVLRIPGLPANATPLVGQFRNPAIREVIFFTSESPELLASALTESGGKLMAAAPGKVTLPKPARQLSLATPDGRTGLLAVCGTNEPALLLTVDRSGAPTLVQALAGATNRVLNSGIALNDAVVLFSASKAEQAASYYQVHVWKEGKFAPAAFGTLASLDDRDEITVPMIHQRIVAELKEKTPAEMRAYTNTIPGSRVTYAMTPIPGGEFVLGSPDTEANRKPDEGPQRRVKLDPFWMGTHEVTWDQFLLFVYPDDEKQLRDTLPTPAEINAVSDAVTRPSKPYVDMSFGMGKNGYPAIAMTQHAANKYCHWLSAKTGHFYRLPTEAEWEYACRAGTTTAYSFGDAAAELEQHAWFFDNSNSKYQKVGKKKPNAWGLYDMHGNVTEWVLDQYQAEHYASLTGEPVANPWNKATQPYPHSVRGGSWDDDAAALRSAARRGSDRSWKMTDPQLPKGKWYFTDAQFIGFRIVRPLTVPPPEDLAKYWISGVEKE